MRIFFEILFYSQIIILPYLTVSLFTSAPVFAYVIDTPKWIWLFLSASLVLLSQILNRKSSSDKKVWELPRFLLPFAAAYGVGILIVVLTAPLGNTETVLTESLLFLVISFWVLDLLNKDKDFIKKLDLWNILSFVLVVFPVAFSLYILKQRVLPFFGSPTMFGEYLGASLCLQFYALLFILKGKDKNFYLRVFLLLVGLAVLYFVRSRAALLGVALAFFALVYFKLHKSIHLKKYTYLVLSVVVVAASFAVYKATVYQDKTISISIRLVRWQNTLQMILDRPLGNGLGNFGATYNRYQNAKAFDLDAGEGMIIANPHNAYLELMAENGVIAALAFVMALLLVAFMLFKKAQRGDSLAILSLALLCFWAVDALFNYPQDTPYAFFLMAVSLGLVLFQFKDLKLKLPLLNYRIFCAFVLCILVVFSFKRFYSEHLAFVHMKDETSVQKACRLDPQNWRACLRKVSLDLEAGRQEEGLRMLEKLQARFPGQFLIQKKIIQLLWDSGQKELACREIKIYDQSYNGNSSLHKMLNDNCP